MIMISNSLKRAFVVKSLAAEGKVVLNSVMTTMKTDGKT